MARVDNFSNANTLAGSELLAVNSYQNGVILLDDHNDTRVNSSNSRSPPRHQQYRRQCLLFGESNRWIIRLVGLFTIGSILALIRFPLSPDHGISVSSSSSSTDDLHKRFYPFYADVVDALHELDSQMEGTIYMFDQRGFESAALVWNNLANQQFPFAVIQVQNEQDVQHAMPVLVQLKERYGIPFRVRSGGHHKAGYSSVEDGIVVSLVRMNSIELDSSSNATGSMVALFEPAVLVQDVLTQVLLPYGYAGVVGICGSVAESGFVLGGGFGFQSRLRGLGLDQVVGMRIVLADGSVKEVDENHNTDLFWALRGAGGGNYGIVTQIRLELYPAQDTQLMAEVAVPYQDLPMILQGMGELDNNQKFPRELCVLMAESASGKNNKIVVNFMWFTLGPTATITIEDARRTFNNALVNLFNGTTVHKNWTIGPVSWAGTIQYSMDKHGQHSSWPEPPWIKPYVQAWTGYMYHDNNTLDVWNDIISQMSIILQECNHLSPHIELWGGAIPQMASWNATAFVHRNAIYNVGVLLYVPSFDNPNTALQEFQLQSSRVTAWWPNVSQYLNGVYNNYPMASLSSSPHRDDDLYYPRAYWGDNLERLVKVKQKYDPTNVFQFEQSVPMDL